jgi:mRNA-degrading endonuclease RelE of RelBE toxin-antitoxin system
VSARDDESPTFTVRFPNTVARWIENEMPSADARALMNYGRRVLALNPEAVGTALRGALRGKYSVTRERYRIIYSVNWGTMHVDVLRVDMV